MQQTMLAAVAFLLVVSFTRVEAGIYTKSSPVLQVDAKSYEKVIGKSSYTSIVKFYAPWCGHCQNLKPAYEKAASNLAGLANVAAVNCEDDINKSLCGSFGVQGFPTLKLVRPSKSRSGKPMVEDYSGQRSAAAIVDAVINNINNHVQKVTDTDVDSFLEGDGPKALAFSDKGKTGALLKSIAIDFLGVMPVGQVKHKQEQTVKRFGVTRYPTLILFPGDDAPPLTYEGEMKKAAIVEFLSQAGKPKPSSSPIKAASREKTASPAATKPSADPVEAAPVIVDIAAIPTLHAAQKLTDSCLSPKSPTCILVFLPGSNSEEPATAVKALDTLAKLALKHSKNGRPLIPFYAVPSSNPGARAITDALELGGEVEVVAVNGRRGWWRKYDGDDVGADSVERWIDAIRMGEGTKTRLPEGLLKEAETEVVADTVSETTSLESEETEHKEL